LGLNLFIASVGLAAGVNVVQSFQRTGLSFLLSGILLSQLPITVALILGKSVLKMRLILLFGTVTGARPLL
jgi:putative transport protein